jgi:magnesium chelatase subunit D
VTAGSTHDRPGNAPTSYPFTAIVGQERMRLALVLNAIDPRIGGVLVRGEKGTAKSTMARSLAELLPEIEVVAGCRYSCHPYEPGAQCDEHRAPAAVGAVLPRATRQMRVVDLPANATEDRLAGTLDIQAALTRGEYRFSPGLLAEANRGILYVDEVNLLADHLVDLLLDAAAMGRNTVEREGVSVSHPARFILLGTMNPEEGELRPQLLDRFGLCVDVAGLTDIDARVQVMRRRAAFETDPAAFAAAWQPEQAALRAQVEQARALLPRVEATNEIVHLIAALAVDMEVDGHRADLVILRAATAIAALAGRIAVSRDDVQRAAALALPHRMRRRPFEQERFTDDKLQEAVDRLDHTPPTSPAQDDASQQDGHSEGESLAEPPPSPDGAEPPLPPRTSSARPSDPLALPTLNLARDRTPRSGAGRRQRSISDDHRGRFVRAEKPTGPSADIALAATVRAAAVGEGPGVGGRGSENEGHGDTFGINAGARPPASGVVSTDYATPRSLLPVPASALRTKVRERKVGTSIIFIVDASGSMAAQRRMEAAKGAALTLLTQAYQRRDHVALIAFRGDGAETLLPLTDSVEVVQQRLATLPTGGRTPLAAGVRAGLQLLRQVRTKDPRAICVPVLITDGKANVAENGGSPLDEAYALAAELQQPGVHPLVLDSENGSLSFGLAAQLAERAGAQYVRLSDLTAEAVAMSVRGVVASPTG